MKRVFEGVISFDGKEYKLLGRGNGPISSLANALRPVGVDLEVNDYKEHSIGRGRDVKAATYIECSAAGSNQKVWGVGIHVDVVQSSLQAMLSAASNVSIWTHTYNTPDIADNPNSVRREPPWKSDPHSAHPAAIPESGT